MNLMKEKYHLTSQDIIKATLKVKLKTNLLSLFQEKVRNLMELVSGNCCDRIFNPCFKIKDTGMFVWKQFLHHGSYYG